jgi:hypothetical protein
VAGFIAWIPVSLSIVVARDGNPAGRSAGQVVRIAIDGSSEESLSLPNSHHDLSVTPDNGALLFTNDDPDHCGRVTKLNADGTQTVVFDIRAGLGNRFTATGDDPCHCNSIHYNPGDDSITFSCLTLNTYFKLDASGRLLWVLGGGDGLSDFSGDGAEWNRQHGHHMLTEDSILFFNNRGTREDSLAIQVELDLDTMTATESWSYEGGNSSITLGDVQRLTNGNTLVSYCNAGVVHEVNADSQLVQEWEFEDGIGYVEHRHSLYGPPDVP